MFILIWIIIVMFLLIFVAISEYEIAKQDEEWLKEFRKDDIWKKEEKTWKEK
jgi:hypothetical protein|nr:MAG TPA: hypothetical protein [Caudoviricetes sp.]